MDKINLSFKSVVMRDEDGFSSLCLDLNVASEGDTILSAKENLIEAVNGYIELALENNLPILRPVSKDINPYFCYPEDIVEEFTIKSDLNIHTYA